MAIAKASFFLALALCIISIASPGHGFEITNASVDVRAAEGDTVTLYCKADDFFEYCTWSHKRSYCEFEWKSGSDSVERQRCSVSLARRIKFAGSYPNHECKVELRDVSQYRDSGEWECQVESYVWGVGRGWTVRNKINVTVGAVEQQTVKPRAVLSTKPVPMYNARGSFDYQSADSENSDDVPFLLHSLEGSHGANHDHAQRDQQRIPASSAEFNAAAATTVPFVIIVLVHVVLLL